MVDTANGIFGTPSRRDMLRLGALSGAGLILTGSLAACGASSKSSSSTGSSSVAAKPTTKTLVYGQGTGPLNLDPLGPGLSTPLLGIWRQTYDTLVWSEGGKIVPQLAKSWTMVDALTWEFKLRTDVKFHNGEVFDADSVKFTTDRILDPAQKSTQAARFTAVKSTEVVDAETVRIHTSSPFPVLLFGLTQAFIVPPQYLTADPTAAATKPVGTGPFTFVSFTQGDNIKFTANSSYWGGAPLLAGVTMRTIADDATRLAALRAGEIDIDQNLPYPYDPDKAKSLLAQAGYPNGFQTTLNGPIGKYTADRDLVVAIAAQLQKVGIKATANPMEYSVFVQKLGASQLGPMFLIGWYNFGDPALSAVWFSSQSTLGTYYNDPTYDALITKAAQTVDTAQRQSLYEQSSQRMYDQAMALYLTQPATYWGLSKKVVNFDPRDDEIAYLYKTSLS